MPKSLGDPNNKDARLTALGRNFVLFKTDLFVFRPRDEDIDKWCVGGDCAGWFYVRLLLNDHIQRDSDPIMEDWGWTFSVSAHDLTVCVNVWAYLIENCWLFGVETRRGWFQRRTCDRLIAAKDSVANAIESIIKADTRFVKHAWFAENPFDLDVGDF